MLLARQGYRVLLVDRASFPSDTISTHYIHQPGVARLALGAARPGRRGDARRSAPTSFDLGPIRAGGEPTPVDGVADGYGPRRTVLDTILVEAAVEAGAELRERFSVDDCSPTARVTGIRGRAAGGATVTERARIVIGADGLRSLVARSVEAPVYNDPPRSPAATTRTGAMSRSRCRDLARDGRSIVPSPPTTG